MLDTNLRQEVYLNHPVPYIPESKPGAYRGSGRKKSSYVTDQRPSTVKKIAENLSEESWQTVTYRPGSKGWLSRQAAVVEVYL